MGKRQSRVYWNLHRKCWSIKTGNDPIRHADSVFLSDCTFRVWQSGRQRVLREKRKTVHAFACGTVAEAMRAGGIPSGMVAVSYNPYRKPEEPGHFYRKDTGERVDGATVLVLTADGKVFASLGN